MHPKKTSRWIAVVAAAAVAIALGRAAFLGRAPRSPGAPASSRHDAPASNKKMAALLKATARELDPETTPYLNRRRVELLRTRNEAALGPEEALELRVRLGIELLRAGDTAASIAELKALWPLFEATRADDKPMRWFLHQAQAIAHMRLAEEENCVARHTSESCLFPLRAGGIHKLERGSRAALRELAECLRLHPGDLSSRWLLNVAHMTLGEYPHGVPSRWLMAPQVFASEAAISRFVDVAPDAGVAVVGLSGGAVVEDFSGDGRLDIVCSSWGLDDPLRFFVNTGGGAFEERTEAAGLEGLTGGLNLCQADFDNDGRRDILVLRGAWLTGDVHFPNSLLRNGAQGKFEDVTESSGLLSFHPTQTAAWGDYDNDGWLDLFVGNEASADSAHPSELYHNDGGTFTPHAAACGLEVTGFVKGVTWGDYDNDGWIDLFVSRLGEPNLLLRNGGPKDAAAARPSRLRASTPRPWAFEDVTARAGVAQPEESFPAWFWDYDNDGWLDLFVASYGWTSAAGDVAADYLGLPHEGERPRLYRNRSDGTFADVTRAARVDRMLIAMGANFGDLDGDGYLDFYVGTGEPDLGAIVPNRMFLNVRGERFADVTTAGGFGHLQKGHAVAFGDLDGDGDEDIYTVLGGAYEGDTFQNALFENPGHGNRWVTLDLEGRRANRDALGARLEIRVTTADGARSIHRVVGSGGTFGASSLQQEVGLGRAQAVERVIVRWPGGATEHFEEVAIGGVVKIREGEGTEADER